MKDYYVIKNQDGSKTKGVELNEARFNIIKRNKEWRNWYIIVNAENYTKYYDKAPIWLKEEIELYEASKKLIVGPVEETIIERKEKKDKNKE